MKPKIGNTPAMRVTGFSAWLKAQRHSPKFKSVDKWTGKRGKMIKTP